MSEPTLILFDCDGTLMNGGVVVAEVMKETFVNMGMKPPSSSDVFRLIGLNLDIVIQRLGVEDENIHIFVSEYKKNMLQRREKGPLYEPLYDGVLGLLQKLSHQPHLLLGVATGKSLRGLMLALKHHEIDRYFTVFRTPDHGPGKPDPFMITDAAKSLGITSERTMMIGDTSFDMKMACAAHAKAVGVSWGYHSAEHLFGNGAGYVAADTRELYEIIMDF